MFTSQQVHAHALANLFDAPDTLATEDQFLEAAIQLHAKAGKRGIDLNKLIEDWLKPKQVFHEFRISVVKVPSIDPVSYWLVKNTDTLEDIFGREPGRWALYTRGIEIDRKLWKYVKPVPEQEYFFTKVIETRG